MTAIRFTGFIGENRALHPTMLPESVCTSLVNQKPGRGDLRPWKSPSNVATVPSGTQTIYRMGRDIVSDSLYWLSWNADVDVVRGFNSDDTGERTYYTGDGAPKWTDFIKATASSPYPAAYRDLGVPAPNVAPTLIATGGTSTITEARYYLYTYVTSIGEESAPSPVSAVLNCKKDDTITINSLAAAPSGANDINRIRVYRTQSNGSSTDFYFIKEISSSLTNTTEGVNTQLTEPLPTNGWLTPPSNLTALTGMWNGMIAGISDRAVRICEPYAPYAWPIKYEILPSNSKPIGLGVFAQNLVILTNSKPIVVTGASPDAMDEQPMDFLQACVSKRSIVSMSNGVAWASPDGLCFISKEGYRVLTDGIMTRDDWQSIVPSSIKGCMYESRYVGLYTVSSVTKGFVIDVNNPQGIYFFDFNASFMFFDELQDQLYLLNGTNVQKWDAGANDKTVTAKSKEYLMPRPTQALAVAQVDADSYANVTFKLYADGVLKHTQAVTSRAPFRLPGGYRAMKFQIEVSSVGGAVQNVFAAHTVDEIAQL